MQQEVKSFLNHLAVEKGLSHHTVVAYRNDLRQLVQAFNETAQAHGAPINEWADVTPEILITYSLSLRQRAYSPATIARKVAAVRSLFHFLLDEAVVSENPAEGLAMPRTGRNLPRAVREEEVEQLFAAIGRETRPETPRDMAMLELMYATGMRVSELVSLNLRDLNLEEGYVKCVGKGSHERLLPLHQRAVEVMRAYLVPARTRVVTSHAQTAVFLNRRGGRLTRQGFWLILKAYTRQAGLERLVTPHVIRHSFATHMLRGGAPLRHVQSLLGHASIATTQVYTEVSGDLLQRQYDKGHPRA